MGRRQQYIARSVVRALTNGSGLEKRSQNALAWILSLFAAFFSLYQLALRKIRPADFASLRREHWELSDDDYMDSFQADESSNKEEVLKPIGDMGFSGSASVLAVYFLRHLLTRLGGRPFTPPPIKSTWPNRFRDIRSIPTFATTF